ncbi:hypothetical protein SAMN02910447_01875 [Ruminococcus sp. YE71]|uniref:hypothetical protein n=1 Tax=unclassified Ruminococcus TaxID=2608920 RepID=UPI0008866056|nr:MULTISPECIES: hypothetical protein [unclassified Ruminococcus]SDA20790.1 hypothetical protein SAMN02910446_01795 [Ruminococcus sp. YE78]SFW33604.1 hypothetical protein SAMN02910447_01875 [Ruminococcus sp. YE71]
MKNDVTQCWFYQLCKKSCAKDVGFIFVGAALILVCLLLFKIVFSTYQIIGIVLGGALIVSGLSAFFKKLPKVRAFLEGMPAEWLATLGNVPPQDWYKTFYFTQYYLCIPSEYIMVRYSDITEIQIQRKLTNNVTSGYSVVFTIAGRSDCLNVPVLDWKSFGTGADKLVEEINNRKLAMMQSTQEN